ncbi:MAG: 6,7-dimethyl-8-ribityllumazine synthase [Bacteroidota bacterium]
MSATSTGSVAIVMAKWNSFITERLRDGAIEVLEAAGWSRDRIVVVECPGAFEIPTLAQALLEKDGIDGVIGIGAIIRGDTPHFDYVAMGVTRGLGDLSIRYGKPVIFGVLTTNTVEQAMERAGERMGNKGAEAAATLLEMLEALARIRSLSV